MKVQVLSFKMPFQFFVYDDFSPSYSDLKISYFKCLNAVCLDAAQQCGRERLSVRHFYARCRINGAHALLSASRTLYRRVETLERLKFSNFQIAVTQRKIIVDKKLKKPF